MPGGTADSRRQNQLEHREDEDPPPVANKQAASGTDNTWTPVETAIEKSRTEATKPQKQQRPEQHGEKRACDSEDGPYSPNSLRYPYFFACCPNPF